MSTVEELSFMPFSFPSTKNGDKMSAFQGTVGDPGTDRGTEGELGREEFPPRPLPLRRRYSSRPSFPSASRPAPEAPRRGTSGSKGV